MGAKKGGDPADVIEQPLPEFSRIFCGQVEDDAN